jgi:hypothetical protein
MTLEFWVFLRRAHRWHQVIGDRFKIQMHKLHLVGRLNLCPSKPIATAYLLVYQAFLKVQGQEELFTQTNSNHILSMGCCVRSDKVNRALKFIAESFRDSCWIQLYPYRPFLCSKRILATEHKSTIFADTNQYSPIPPHLLLPQELLEKAKIWNCSFWLNQPFLHHKLTLKK